MLLLEREIQTQIIDYLTKTGWKVIRNYMRAIRYKGGNAKNPNSGMPDLLAIKNGKYVWIEVKTPKGLISKTQQEYITSLRNHGATVLVATSYRDVMLYM
jgi:Holliday junction resolvase